MKAYYLNGYEYFYDRFMKHWVCFLVDENKNRIEWDTNDNPIEAVTEYTKGGIIEYIKKVSNEII